MAMVLASPSPISENRSLYVGDLDPGISEADLFHTFAGPSFPVASLRLCRDSVTGKSLGYAYINYFNHFSASKALNSLNHTNLKGKPVRVMWSQRDPLPRKTSDANLFVKNLDVSVDSAGLQDIFSKFGTVVSCKVAEDHGNRKGFGFVQFESEESATNARNALHDTLLCGKKIYVSKFVKKTERTGPCQEPKFTNLYVKDLDQDLTEELLREKFSEFGTVCSVAIMKDGQGESRGFGFINFESPENAKKAVESMNGAQLGSKKIFVGRAQKKAERVHFLKSLYEETRDQQIQKSKASNLYVKNLDASIDDTKLREHFSAFGEITSAKVMRYNNGISKGFGFVSFSTPEAAARAMFSLHGTMFHGRSLYVALARRKEDRLTALVIHYADQQLGSVYPSFSKVAPPGFPPTHQYFPPQNAASRSSPYQPVIHQHFGTKSWVLLPHEAQGDRATFPIMNPHLQMSKKQMQQMQSKDWGDEFSLLHAPFVPYIHQGILPINVNQGIKQQQPMKYSTTSNCFSGVRNSGGAFENKKTHQFKNMGNKTSCSVETSSHGSRRLNGKPAAASSWDCKQAIGNSIYPLIRKRQPDLAPKITGMLLEMNNSDLAKLQESPAALSVQVENAVQVLKQANTMTSAVHDDGWA